MGGLATLLWMSIPDLRPRFACESRMSQSIELVLVAEHTPISQITTAAFPSRQIARTFRRKSTIFARNSQNQIRIVRDGNSHL